MFFLTGDFLDEAIIKVEGGKGGDGAVSFRREKFVERGGPDGGDGGNGGSVIVKSTINKNTLIDFRYKKIYKAENGENGKNKKRTGKSGNNIIIEVPVGTCIYDSKSGELISDLKYPEQYIVAVSYTHLSGLGRQDILQEKVPPPISKTIQLILT